MLLQLGVDKIESCSDAEAMYEYGEIMEVGELGRARSVDLANLFYEKAARLGHPVAMAKLAGLNPAYKAAAFRSGCPFAQALKLMLCNEAWSISPEVHTLLVQAARQSHTPRAILLLGTEDCLAQAADAGVPTAIVMLVCKLDTALSHAWTSQMVNLFALACDQGYMRARLALISLFYNNLAWMDWGRAARLLAGIPAALRVSRELLKRRINLSGIDRRLHVEDHVRECFAFGRAHALGWFCHMDPAHKVYEIATRSVRAAIITLLGILRRHRRLSRERRGYVAVPLDLCHVIGKLVWDARDRTAPQWLSEQEIELSIYEMTTYAQVQRQMRAESPQIVM